MEESDQMVKKDDTLKWITIDSKIVSTIKSAINAALAYENKTKGTRKLGITGEVGEALVCNKLGLRLMLDTRSEGFDALDSDGKRVEIKSRRSESIGLPRDAGRTSKFSEHPFDYALLGLLNQNYELCEVWRAEYNRLLPVIEKQKRKNPSLASFKSVAKKIFPPD